ncbi:MAG: ABC transporter ATP-binding protein [Zestosphaera sp.]
MQTSKTITDSSEDILLAVKDLRVWYPVRKLLSVIGYVKAIDGVTLAIRRGEICAIVGESGSGKTTFGKAILRLIKPTGGEVFYKNVDISKLSERDLKWYRKETGMVQQDPYGAMPSFMSIKKILEEPLIIHRYNEKPRLERVMEALEEVKLTPPEDFINKYPHMLSGGQLQRVAIARALILKPTLVVADEPVSMLDASVRIETLSLFKSLQKKYNLSVVYITHDFSTAKYFSDRIAVMYAGQLVEIGPATDIITAPKHPYTISLINVIPDPDPANRFKIKETLQGEPPNLMEPPAGCRLHPRCPYVMEVCKNQEPPMYSIESEHYVKCWLYANR